MEDHEKVKKAILAVLELGCGFEVNLFAMLDIHQLEDGRYRIMNTDVHEEDGYAYDVDDGEEIYENLNEAVERFLQLRKSRRLGYDFEKDWFESEYGDENDT